MSATARIIHADCRDAMREIAENTVDAVVTDPPYELGFMGRAWDRSGVANDSATWSVVFRVMKPGAHLLAFSGTRTYHRMVCAIENAGFEIRDQVGWAYGQGFPKSKNLDGEWDGWGTALKPAWEPIVVARKPLSEATVAANVLRWGTGAINIRACRVGTDGGGQNGRSIGSLDREKWRQGAVERSTEPTGRWPANLIHDGSQGVLELFPESSVTGKRSGESKDRFDASSPLPGSGKSNRKETEYTDSGSAARFFYCAKASASDRDGSNHPTVKPRALMRYLCRLVTPPGGLVLDPFAGSGSTLYAAQEEGFSAIGIEQDADYVAHIAGRMNPSPHLHAPEPVSGATLVPASAQERGA